MDTNIWDVQASTPNANGITYPNYTNLRLHVLTQTMERAIELMHEHHPQAKLHQIIKRTSVMQVIVDPTIYTEKETS